ncbi:MAG TPA: hypothetical protein VHV77_15340 [Pirellulales bacterium]|nr:hypothetical protein [Pirellulales bacterium]
MNSLNRVLDAARTHPLYREHWGNVATLAEAPIVTKRELAARLDALVEASQVGLGIYWSSSGGSGGRAMCFPVDVHENHQQRRLLANRIASAGILTAESVVLNLFPSCPMVRSSEIFTEFSELCGGTPLPSPVNSSLREGATGYDEAWGAAERFGANVLAGMPSALVDFAYWCGVEKRRCSFDTVLFGGEFLHPQRRAMFEALFEVKRFAAVYGSAETGIVGYTSDVREPAVYAIPREIAVVEIPRPDAEGVGNLVVTNLVRLRHPLVRFDTGDRGRIVGETDNEMLIELHARDSGTFEFQGAYHELSRLARVLDLYGEWQLVIGDDVEGCDVQGREKLTCLIAAEAGISGEDEAKLLAYLGDQIDPYDGGRIEIHEIAGNQFRTVGVSDKRPQVVDLRRQADE